jgi:aspartate 1-decarboxylase
VQVGQEPREICLNGAAARLGQPGDLIIIMSFALLDESEAKAHKPRIVYMAENNELRVDQK